MTDNLYYYGKLAVSWQGTISNLVATIDTDVSGGLGADYLVIVTRVAEEKKIIKEENANMANASATTATFD
ncbi:hypothetical protein L484_024525 [Morus notabilis]|uniref:Uncharacterized protein n=1 Tax=Morus notabilis TaxID=981085 RepID=W9RI13_9ROSA|nr:hypothetical protein L484_024525 [Morus notabilis]